MPFGLSFAQIMDLANEIPDLVGDVKKMAPKLAPLIAQASSTIAKLERAGTLNDAAIAVTSAKGALSKLAEVMEAGLAIVREVEKEGLTDDVARLLTQVHALLPELPPVIAKISRAMEILGSSDTPEQAKAAIANTDWQKVAAADRAGGVSSGM